MIKVKTFLKWFNRVLKIFSEEERNEILTAIALLKEEKDSQWILVSERLPNDSRQYLITELFEDECEVKIADADWMYNYHESVVAWRNLPKPYIEGLKNMESYSALHVRLNILKKQAWEVYTKDWTFFDFEAAKRSQSLTSNYDEFCDCELCDEETVRELLSKNDYVEWCRLNELLQE